MAYSDELLKKQFKANAVIQLKGQYFCVRQPDSGLTIAANYQGTIRDLSLSPTQVDLRAVNTTIANYSFTLHDKAGVLSTLFGNNAYLLTGETVNIWLGRTTGSFDFSSYFQLQPTKVKTVKYNGDKSYTFTVAEQTDRMNKSIFSLSTTLSGSILSSTTAIAVQSNTDLSTWPTSGVFRIDNEFGTYAGVDNVLKQLTGCTRGYKGTTAVSHNAGATVYCVVDVQDNPLTILLDLLISKGGGGIYDVLSDGLGLSNTLVDVAGIESIRDTYFVGNQFQFSLYNIPNALKFIETEILAPCNLRLTSSSDGKISVAILNISPFNPSPTLIDEHTMTNPPTWIVDENLIINQISVQWDWDEGTQTYKQITPYSDAASITQYGAKPVFTLQCKGPKASLSGQTFVDTQANRMLGRFKQPMPQVDVTTQMNTSLLSPGAKGIVATSKLPTMNGDYNFWSELEVLSRAINFFTGDVTFSLMFTQYSNVRQCFIAPADPIVSVTNQSTFTVPTGKGASYTVGWVMRLWDVTNGKYFSDAVNTIQSIVGDTITMTNAFTTILSPTTMAIKFPYYDEATTSQHAYGFIGIPSSSFPDGSPEYQITF